MPINRTTTYVCDGCGKEINHHKDRHHVVNIVAYNYSTLAYDNWEYTHVFCEECNRAMWKAIRAIPRIREMEDGASQRT